MDILSTIMESRPPLKEVNTSNEKPHVGRLAAFPKGPWTKLLNAFPVLFDSTKLIRYESRNGAQKHYNSGYRMFDAKKVTNVLLCYKSEENVYVSSKVEKSMSLQKYYSVQISILKTGDVQTAYCQCKAGNGGVCKHVVATLWFLLHHRNMGSIYIPDDQSCTEKQRVWGTGSKLKNISTLNFSKLVFEKKIPEVVNKNAERIQLRKKKREEVSFKVTPNMLKNMHERLSSANINYMQRTTILKANFEPVIYEVENMDTDQDVELISDRPNLPFKELWNDEFRQLCRSSSAELPQFRKISLPESWELKKNTFKQSASPLWIQERTGLITASDFGAIVNRRAVVTQQFVDRVFKLNQKFVATRFMTEGLLNEKCATEKYLKMSDTGSTKYVYDCGLSINPGLPCLGASPDKLVYDSASNEYGLLEIKTLSKAKSLNLTMEQARKAGLAKCFRKNGEIKLATNHKFYAQIQGQLGITGLQWCDLIVDVGNEFHVERIYFDILHWTQTMLPKLVTFFINHAPKQ